MTLEDAEKVGVTLGDSGQGEAEIVGVMLEEEEILSEMLEVREFVGVLLGV